MQIGVVRFWLSCEEKIEFRCRRESRGNGFRDPSLYDARLKCCSQLCLKTVLSLFETEAEKYPREREPNGYLSGRMLRPAVCTGMEAAPILYRESNSNYIL